MTHHTTDDIISGSNVINTLRDEILGRFQHDVLLANLAGCMYQEMERRRGRNVEDGGEIARKAKL